MSKKPANKLKEMINYSQKNDSLYISGKFARENFQAKEMWLFSKDHQTCTIKVAEIEPSNSFKFTINLSDLLAAVKEKDITVLDWYFKIRTPLDVVPANRKDSEELEIVEQDEVTYAEYFIRCGRFNTTHEDGLSYFPSNEDKILNYITTKGNFSLVFNAEPEAPTRIQIDKVKKRKSTIKIMGKLFTRNSKVLHCQFYLQGRNTGAHLHADSIQLQHLSEQVKANYGLNRYAYTGEIDFSKVNNGAPLENDIYDLFLKVELHDMEEPKYIRIGRPTFRARLFLRDLNAVFQEEANVIHPYFTFKMSNLSFEVYKYDVKSYHYLKKIMRWSWLLRKLFKKQDTWIIGERTYKAQDTGYAFFKHMRETYPDKNIYYVIESDSPEKKNVEPLGNVLDYRSREHMWKTLIATKVISSHHPDYLYPIRTEKFKNKVKADKVFLQHGVMGTKNMVANYGKNSPGFDTDFFIVSSPFEKRMIVTDFGYSPNNVFVTGLSRFDTLFKKDVAPIRQLLIIPTWRDWIITDEAFLESEYYEKYRQLINSDQLKTLADHYNFKVLFCLHPNMQQFSNHFDADHIQIVQQGEIDVQYLIKQSAMMLTDYSSVGFDFSFLHKPVLYYQFDRSRFIGKRPSHLDLDNELPGEIAFDYDVLLEKLEGYAKNDFQMKEEYKQRANKFIQYRDQNSSQRIFEHIEHATVKKSIFEHEKINILSQALYKKFRRSKYYFPTMKAFYNLGSYIIPVDPKLILFESGIGKQYADSPRVIYEEMLEQGLEFKKIWVYNRNYRFNDPDTKKIVRLSPQYYFYLLRARYWVNNQNFPAYLKKRSKTTYLQTWHGTPLKRMLFDIENIQGRNDDYLERIGNTVKNWDYLISPSRYASEKFQSAFRYTGEILELGYPRNDIFFIDNKEEYISKIKNKLQLPKDKKIILYAPTFRDDQTSKRNKFLFDLNLDLYKMQEHLGNDYILLLRMHVVISNKIKIDPELQDFVKNVSNYPDIQELSLMTDILVTDYSSIMFDFANTKKPIIFYTYDFDNYRDNLRGFYMDFENEAPGPFVYDTEQLINNIEDIEKIEAKYKEKYTAFHEKYCYLDDGSAGKRVVNKVFK
ncbi:CDP-glycerol glycerophosphotransferase family protein [Gracilibacillus alcaliphilus]|uniref:CDP-glycerol glycerophosphotransferase family protein n=1 Tax=Gracilibacillus alcaliphilus TaxID=1401441 RepID=UPI00195A5FD8|nr:CDP-glycerol glycerophosphotransferase family protein [Gracilibacillus alcaliphilus]MBM7678422.1 CDP-glycerol glycerophosphotransferase [Gracilibacillus alcaliphilus]